MNLKDAVRKGQPVKPPRMVLIGEEGVGKSTFANGSPNPIFLTSEDGLVGPEFDDTANFTPKTWEETMEFIRELTTSDHEYKTLVIDTMDWLEPLLFEYMCKRDGKSDIEAYGFHKGYNIAAMEWRMFLAMLDFLRTKKGMIIVITSHCEVKNFKNPIGDDYDKFSMRSCKEVASLTREWADTVLFARFETFTEKDKNGKAKGIGGTDRVIQTTECAAWHAKNRYSLPSALPLKWKDVASAIRSHYAKKKEAK